MSASLPPKPSLEQLKKEAKDLRKAHRAGDASCCEILRRLHRFAAASDAAILAADVPLKEVQFALAMHYGFKTWQELSSHVVAKNLQSGSDNAGIEGIETEEFLATYERGFPKFAEGSEPLRRGALARALGIAEESKGTDMAARALLVAANAYVGGCGDNRLLTEDGWDRMIALYQRAIDECPKSRFAEQGQWGIALAHGCWAPNGCCHFLQGKQEWEKAVDLYWGLYRATTGWSRAEALRRIAEIQCARTGQWREGLQTWQRLRQEQGEAMDPSSQRRWDQQAPPTQRPAHLTCTERGCGRAMTLEYFLLTFTFRPAVQAVQSGQQATELRDAFVGLIPQNESIRAGTLVELERALQKLGDRHGAEKVKGQLGLCEQWVVIGPFSGNPDLTDEDLRAINLPPEVRPLAFQSSGEPWGWWDQRAPQSMVQEMLTAYGPEQDYLAGRLDLTKAYPVTPVHERDPQGHDKREGRRHEEGTAGKAVWVRASSVVPSDNWDANGTVYGLTYVASPVARDVQLRVGLSGQLRAWVNGEKVLATDQLHDYTSMDSFTCTVRLHQGRNQLFVKFTPYGGGEPVPIRIVGKDGLALANVRFSAPNVPEHSQVRSAFLLSVQSARTQTDRLGWIHR
ncbi:MAG: hypothetical protein NTV86_11620 [Planctomycetota bacterium]|nr:hypothetical protein [Planctomycetota bacterium]